MAAKGYVDCAVWLPEASFVCLFRTVRPPAARLSFACVSGSSREGDLNMAVDAGIKLMSACQARSRAAPSMPSRSHTRSAHARIAPVHPATSVRTFAARCRVPGMLPVLTECSAPSLPRPACSCACSDRCDVLDQFVRRGSRTWRRASRLASTAATGLRRRRDGVVARDRGAGRCCSCACGREADSHSIWRLLQRCRNSVDPSARSVAAQRRASVPAAGLDAS